MAIPATTDVTTPDAEQKSKKRALIWMIIAQAITVFIVIAGLAIGSFGAMFADGVGKFLGVAIICPILLAFPLIGSWVAYKKDKVKLGLVITTVVFILMTCACSIPLLITALGGLLDL